MKIHKVNLLLTLSSLSVILVTIERFSFTTRILLQPYSFLRLHELFQMAVLILFTTLIPFFLLREVSANFEELKTKRGIVLGTLFIAGVYFYATGNGLHELASFQFNTFCNVKHFSGTLCSGMFFNDFYTGNILYFIGAALMNIVLVIIERIRPNEDFKKKDLILLIINSLVYAFAIFAYAAFDRVLVGLVYSIIMMIAVGAFFLTRKKNTLTIPVTTSFMIAYIIGTTASLIVRFH